MANRKFTEKFKEWKSNVLEKITNVAAKVVAWSIVNWQVVLMILPVVGGVLKHMLKLLKMRKEEEWRNRRFYDRKTDRWCYANRHLNRRQEDIIERRYKDGETYREILGSMGLLK